MKFLINQEDFSRALTAASRSLPVKPTLPVLSNILISCEKDEVEVVATNLEAASGTRTVCKTKSEGKITVPGRILLEYVSQLPSSEITVEVLGEEVLVTSLGYSARFATVDAEEFPQIPKISGGIEIVLSKDEFAKAINRIHFTAAADEGRPVLNGVLCEVSKKKLSMVATDGYRLGYAEAGLTKEASGLKMVVPVKALTEVAKLIAEDKEEAEFKFQVAGNLSQASFTVGNVEYTTRLIEGQFPNWQKIIPTEFATKVKLAKDEFLRQMKIASIFARDSGNIVKLKFEGKSLTVSSSAAQVASNEINVDVAMEGKGCEIAFNWRYIIEAVGAFEGEDITFELNESLNPGKISSGEPSASFFHIIMPVRLQG